MNAAKPKRPMRAILAFSVIIALGLGVAAYLVNVSLLWIGIGEALALIGIGFRATKVSQTQPLAETAHDQATKP
ncbi:MAG: hypothetical protein ACRENH_15335 [Gemmatimonadaceae bacterium]